ncbi:MAG: phosphatidate cytidylyltransferase [Bacilli bacterium]
MKKRIISAIVLLLIFIPLLIIGGLPFRILGALVSLLAIYELLNIRENRKKFPLFLKIITYIITVILTLYNTDSTVLNYSIDYRYLTFIIFFYLISMVLVNDKKKYNINDAFHLIGSTLFIGMSFNLILQLRNYSIFYVIYIFLITTMTDMFAMEIGKRIGKHKMVPEISPKKTWEGSIGGVIMGTFIPTVFYYQVIGTSNILLLIVMTMILSVVAQFGDLSFSAIKRYYDKKDFSNLIPGHGGILDRLDSVIFVVLVFVILLSFI